MRIVPSTTCGGPPPSELKLARRIGSATLQLNFAVRIDAYPTVLSLSATLFYNRKRSFPDNYELRIIINA